jgi:hypothetical protein
VGTTPGETGGTARKSRLRARDRSGQEQNCNLDGIEGRNGADQR